MAQDDPRPNIIFILADDVGAESMDMYGGSSWPTPRINSIATSGMLFQNAYSAPSCAPSRAQFLTGRYQFRNGVTFPSLPNGPLSTTDETTLATILKQNGYATGLAGKWNLFHGGEPQTGNSTAQAQHISLHGFGEHSTFLGHTIDYGFPSPETAFVPYQLSQWAIDFIDQQAGGGKPFYLQYSLGLVHWALGGGLTATPINPTANSGNSTTSELYAAMMTYMDQMVGNVLDAIDQAGIAGNTVVVFAGDNGTWGEITSTWNGFQVQGGKLGKKDTGSWVPLFVRWPGVVYPGSSYQGVTDFSDLFPTFLEIAGCVVPNYRIIDGVSFLPQLKGEESEHREMIYAGQFYGETLQPGRTFEFVRDKRWKLVLQGGSESLYDVANSPVEELSISESTMTPEQTEARDRLSAYLTQLHEAILTETGADSDADGATDFEEVISGTDPTSSHSKFELSFGGLPADGGGAPEKLSFPSALGRVYHVESAQTLPSDSWTPISNAIQGSGEGIEFVLPVDDAPEFFRVSVEQE